MNFRYLFAPFLAWLIAGSLKFLINSLKSKKLAWKHIGYGGMPSNHSAIVSSAAAMIAITEGIGHPAFGVALALAFVVILDAKALRRQIGYQAQAINRLNPKESLRERVGHTLPEIAVGVMVGITSAALLDAVFTFVGW